MLSNCRKDSMAKSRSRKQGKLSQTERENFSGTGTQDQNYDPALVSLFAQSVSRTQMQSTGSQIIDLLPVGRCENCR